MKIKKFEAVLAEDDFGNARLELSFMNADQQIFSSKVALSQYTFGCFPYEVIAEQVLRQLKEEVGRYYKEDIAKMFKIALANEV